MMPLTQPDLTVLGGSGALTVVASGASDIITELNTSTAGGTITANGLNDTIDAANGPNTTTAKGAGNIINLGVVSTDFDHQRSDYPRGRGRGRHHFRHNSRERERADLGGYIDGGWGQQLNRDGANSTVNFGNNIGGGSETVVVMGD